MRRLANWIGLVIAYARLNMNAQLEYRGAFAAQVVAMVVNDSVWLVFWWLFFTRFPVLRGWDVYDVVTVWAVAAAGFGLAHAIFGNGLMLARLIANGQIDVWMLYPRAVLPHLLLGRTSPAAWGDAIFGVGAYVLVVQPDAARFAMFVCLVAAAACVFVGFAVAAGSLGFFVGNAAVLAEQFHFAMITFATYPAPLFRGAVKVLLFTAIPAAFVNSLPVEALRTLSLVDAALAVAGSLAVLAAGAGIFAVGLKRYESGNLVVMRE
jgi:ABC-2 type transport system permease protein